MQPTLFSVIRDNVASAFCCANTQASAEPQAAPIALALRAIANTGRAVAADVSSETTIVLNDDDKKNIVNQFHRSLTRSRYAGGTSRHARKTGQTLAALSLVDKSWRLACKDEMAVARVSNSVADDFDDDFNGPIASIQYIDRTIKNASLRGQAALEIVDAALRRSVSEADLYEILVRPAGQPKVYLYADILRNVLDLENVDRKVMNIIIAKGCNIFWQGPVRSALGFYDHKKLGFTTALLDKMLSHAEHDLPDASKRDNPLALSGWNVVGHEQVCAKWPTLSEMTKVVAGIMTQEGQNAAHTALSKLLDCIQRAPHANRITTTLGVVAYADAFLDRRVYDPFAESASSQTGEQTVNFLFAGIKQRFSKADFSTFKTQLAANTEIHANVKEHV